MHTIIVKNCTDMEAAIHALDAELQRMSEAWEVCASFALPSATQTGERPQFDVAFMLKRVETRAKAEKNA